MALSPADFYAYSRATGAPVPEDPRERAEMAPEVLEFRRNQLKAPQREEEGGFNLTNLLGIGAAAAGLAGGAYGLNKVLRKAPEKTAVAPFPKGYGGPGQRIVRALGREENIPPPSKAPEPTIAPTTPDITPEATPETQVAQAQSMIRRHGRLVPREKAVARQSFTPRSYLESKGSLEELPEAISTEVAELKNETQTDFADLTSVQDSLLNQAKDQLANAVESGEDQYTGRQIQDMQRDTDTVKTSSSAPVTLPVIFSGERQVSPQVQEAERLIGQQRGSTQSPSLLSQVRERRAESRDERANAYRLLRESMLDTSDEINVTELDPTRVGSLSAELLQKAKERTQKSTPAPITQEYKDALFDADPSRPYTMGLLKPEVIARNLGDTNVFPEELQQKLVAAMKPSTSVSARKTGNMGTLELDPAVQLEATNHVIKNLLAEDNADSVKDYLLGGGEYISPRTKGFGYTGTGSEKTQIFTITNDKGNTEVKVSRPKSAARRTRSDLEPLFFDPDTGTLLAKSDLGATQSIEGDVGSGIGQEIGQTVAFVPRKEVAPFVSLPGVSASGPEGVNKNQGTAYAIGGVKEFGTGKESSADLSVPTLEMFTAANDAVEAGKVKISQNGNIYVQVNSLMRQANPALDYDEGVSKYGTLYKNPLTGQNFTSAHEATGVYNQLAKAVNKRLITPAETNVLKIENTENMRLQVNSPTNKSVYMDLNPDLVIDQVTRRAPSGETVTSNVTLSQALRNVLLNPVATDEGGNVIRDTQTGAPLRGPSLIQEQRVVNDDGTPGAVFYKQSRYKVPEDFTYVDQATQETRSKMLGLNDTSLPLAGPDEEGSKNNYLFLEGVNSALEKLTGKRVKVIDDALKIGASPDFHFYGGASKNPVLRQALTVANTLVQTSEPSRVRMRNADEGLGERYGLGERVSARPQSNVPSRMRSADVDPSVLGGQRLVAALKDYKQRTGKAMTKQNVLGFANSIAQQEGVDMDSVLQQASISARGAGEQLAVGKQMTQGRRALSAMDVISPAEEVAQTVAEYDFNETIGSDIENAVQGARLPRSPLTTEQLERAKVEPPGVSSEAIGNLMAQLQAQAGRRSGKRRNR